MEEQKIKILLIEDDPFLLSMYSTKFEAEGFVVITADDGEKGLKAAGGERADIIMLDILMPKMNGFEVLEKLKADEKTKDIPVILLTNLNQKDEIEKGLVLGADDYMIKAHFMPSEVVAKIRKVLGR
ncbi:MAG: Two-component response regulator [Candidatus Falkowbacteria bacterium GW2011_GWC2_38_22]|uniref:Two-component response regulator n=1 Tax=Candidatus Falkowbacteria bacterium GW2011_GWE1_38_31 TaxID=1618638 RepID=A0A0G0JTH7_9BACT|nr:MAG: Two-component response regulator [Candidatus Falkowbacteria bacterium GW2011_GWF2_38_1205]KKQ61105.1 MAG: Two-component response regulator [Candidatus Falkowbacteria bacterium GW2011_GWC2_38_22]KKQ63175.1 MAG: Two-component response regulator [Candidatus Falkowbacteria bacterium GW2011_GWF1_38_22]KKQ65370.1 MAG: Two-component response regulator [Candidatus Falkowbacteria bacterium GW2011_GWE2_38_254]KKQ69947.1 MAG: Two-component response regulator [Candidatus Falkowbacteria bacterium GW